MRFDGLFQRGGPRFSRLGVDQTGGPRLGADLVSCGYKYRSDGKLLLESKEDMRRRGVPSPDLADAVALCFSEPDGSPFPRSMGFNRDWQAELDKRFGGLYA